MDYSQIRLLGDNVLLRKDEEFSEPEKVGSIYIPKTTSATLREAKLGRIVSTGPGKRTKETGAPVPHNLVTDDLVYYARYGGDRFKDAEDGSMMIRCPEMSILARVYPLDGKITIGSIFPRHNKMLVKEIKGDETTSSGLIIPKRQIDPDKQVTEFKVITVGPGKVNYVNGHRTPMTCVPGGKVIAADMNGAKISIWEEGVRCEYRLISESDCYCFYS